MEAARPLTTASYNIMSMSMIGEFFFRQIDIPIHKRIAYSLKVTLLCLLILGKVHA